MLRFTYLAILFFLFFFFFPERSLILFQVDIVVVVQLLSCVRFFVTPCQAFLSFVIPQSLLKLMSIRLVMPSNHLFLCRPLLLLSSRVSTHHLIPTQMFFILWKCPQASLSLENFSCLLLSFSITFYTYFHFSTYHSIWLFHIYLSVSLSDCEVLKNSLRILNT